MRKSLSMQSCVLSLVVLVFARAGFGQFAVDSAADKPNSAANRSLAALDLAIMAAESGLPDVSFEAVKRAVGKGPPLAVVKLGGILSGGQTRNSGYGSSQPSNESSAQIRTAARLLKVNQAWEEGQVSPEECYFVWKEIIFPTGRPSEAFAYSTTQRDTSYSYSFSLSSEEPEPIGCGARALVTWAKKANKLEDLKLALEQRKNMPSAQSTTQLLKLILAEKDDTIDLEAICDKLALQPQSIVSGPDCELLTNLVCKILKKLEDSSAGKIKLWDAILANCQSTDRWASNKWLRHAILHEAEEAAKAGDQARFERFANVAMTILDPLGSGNESYRASMTARFYESASSAAFEAGHIEFGLQAMREQMLAQSTSSTNGRQLIQPNSNVCKNLLKLSPEKRYEMLEEIVWTLPVLGLASAAQRAPGQTMPEAYAAGYKNYRKTDSLPFEAITTRESESVSLLEWVMRDAMKLGRKEDVETHIQELIDNDSDDAVLAKLVWSKVNSNAIDLELVTEQDDEGEPLLRKGVTGSRGLLLPLDFDIARAAIDKDSTRAMGRELAQRLADRGVANRTNDGLHGRSLVAEAIMKAGSKADASQLKHFVVTHDFSGGDLLSGRPTRAYWLEHAPGAWEHYACATRSSLLLKYPLSGNFEISFEASDDTYAESGCTLGGLNLDFRGYQNDVALELIGRRSATRAQTEGIQKGGKFTKYKLKADMEKGSLALFCGDAEVGTFDLGNGCYPFYGIHSMMHRKAVTKNVAITGDVMIPESVDLLNPTLSGWSNRFKNRSLPPVAFTDAQKEAREKAKKPTRADVNYDWQFVDGVLESVDHDELMNMDEKNGEKVQRPKYPIRESWIYYARPLCDGESVTFEFFHEEGQFALSPTIDRTALWIDREQLFKHWITPAGGAWFGVNATNRVAVEAKETLGDIELKIGWNAGSFEREGDTIRISVNGEAIYEQDVDESCGGRIGFFHDPSMVQAKVRNVVLSGNWPEKLPEDLFEKYAAAN